MLLNDQSPNSPVPDDLNVIVERLRTAIRRRFGASAAIGNIDLATMGGSNRTVLFDVTTGASKRRLVLRQETYTFAYSPFLPPPTQYQLIEVAYAHRVPVPEPIFELEPVDGLGRGYLLAGVDGETLPKRLLTDPAFAPARALCLQQVGDILARLHAIDPGEVALLAALPDSRDPLAAQVSHYDHYGEPHPAIEFAFRWLERHRPAASPGVFLHGDFRTGNFIVGPEDGIRSLLDWECAYIGPPEADFGWFCTRSWRFGNFDQPAGGFGSRAALFDAYEAAGGRKVDREAVRWWEIFGLVKWALFNVMQIHGHVSGARRSPVYAACGRNTCLIEYDLLMTIAGKFD